MARQWFLRFLEWTYARTWTVLSRLRPWLKPRTRVARVLALLEKGAKTLLFHCQMCGDCVLHNTGMICPMTCPKNLRNGPCGGVRPDGTCEVDPQRPCVWVQAYRNARQMRTGIREMQTILPPHNWSLHGTSAWVNAVNGLAPTYPKNWRTSSRTEPPVPATSRFGGVSRFERVLRSGRFAVTAELGAPDSANPEDVYRAALPLAQVCDAINVVDASGANVHIASMAVCALLARAGYEPILQISARDRNRIAIQGDLLGAAALGIRNVLFITGDHVSRGDHPEAKPVFDMDSMQMIQTARIMRDDGHFLSGRPLATPPRFFLGAVINPFVPPYDFRVERLAKKVAAGAQFIQTQYCFDVPRLREFMARVRDRGLHQRVYILVGVGPLRSARAAEYMRTHIPGVVIPDAIVDRLRKTPKHKQREEGKRIAVEIVQQVREIEGVAGVHIMAFRQEEFIAEIVEEAGLLPRQPKQRRLAA